MDSCLRCRALALLAYLLGSFATQGLIDKSQWAHAGFAVSISVALSALLGVVVYFLLRAVRRLKGGAKPPSTLNQPGRGLVLSGVLTACAAAVLGGWSGYAKQADAQAASAASKAAIAAERARVAALTPGQRAEAARLREAQAAAAAKLRAEQAAAAAQADAEKERLAAGERERTAKRTGQLQLAGARAMDLKRAMKNPQSFALTSLVVKDNGTACYQYRAQNSFGATLPSSAAMTANGKLLTESRDGNAFVKLWNKECVPPGGDEIAELLRRRGVI